MYDMLMAMELPTDQIDSLMPDPLEKLKAYKIYKLSCKSSSGHLLRPLVPPIMICSTPLISLFLRPPLLRLLLTSRTRGVPATSTTTASSSAYPTTTTASPTSRTPNSPASPTCTDPLIVASTPRALGNNVLRNTLIRKLPLHSPQAVRLTLKHNLPPLNRLIRHVRLAFEVPPSLSAPSF